MTQATLPLAVLQPGDAATVVDVLGEGAFRRRLLDMGFVKGASVRVIKLAPLMNPIEYCVGGTHVTLRRKEAMHIVVEPGEAFIPAHRHGHRPAGRGLRARGRRLGFRRGKGRGWWKKDA
jgi:ferrous iron transport protein A